MKNIIIIALMLTFSENKNEDHKNITFMSKSFEDKNEEHKKNITFMSTFSEDKNDDYTNYYIHVVIP